MDTAKRSLELLLEQDEKKAATLATELVALNNSRKEMTIRETEHAFQIIEDQQMAEDKVLVVYLPNCHESLAGIIAGRIRESFHKPVFVLTKAEEGVKGSGRSIESYAMFDELTGVSDLLTKFGGHPMAAGLSLDEAQIDTLRKRLNEQTSLTEEDCVEKVRIDAVLPFSYLNTSLIRQLKVLEPCGKGNTKPVLATRGIKVDRAYVVGKNQNVLKLHLMSDGCSINGVFFGEVAAFLEYLKEKCGAAEVEAMLAGKSNQVEFAAIYEPTIDTYSGKEQIQVIIRKYR